MQARAGKHKQAQEIETGDTWPGAGAGAGACACAARISQTEKVLLFLLLSLLFLCFHLQSFLRVHDTFFAQIPHDHEEAWARPVLTRVAQHQNAIGTTPASQIRNAAQIANNTRYTRNKMTDDGQQHADSRSQQQKEREFYNYHYQRMDSLANDSSFIVWETRSKSNPFGPLWKLFNDDIYKANAIENPDLKASPYIFWGSICFAALEFSKHRSSVQSADPIPHVLFFRMNENWGGFSQAIPGKTAQWVVDLVGNEWKRQGCRNETIFNYLDHPETLVAITTQFQIFDHPKVHSLPLGIKSISQAQLLLKRVEQHHNEPRTQLLMVNSKPRPMRQHAIDAVVKNFHETVQNTFGAGADSTEQYYVEMQRSKFILSPGGLGFDCYRHWEALYMGTIPVLETLNRSDGWFRTFDDLPVAWIDSYDNLTPEFLEGEYERILTRAHTYRYEKLTKQWWVGFIQSHVPVELRKRSDFN